jgi:uncharacterized phiE125 gp8 family phage protein
MGSLSLITPPAVEPILLDEAKSHCKVEIDKDDALITALIIAARQHAENVTGRQFITATWALKLGCWPCWIDVPRAPLLNVPAVAITYLDTAGATQTLAINQYRVDAPVGPTAARGTIERAFGVTWPTLYSVSNNVTVTFTAGYGATPDTVPQAIKQALLLMIGHWYINRESVITGTISVQLPQAVDALLAPFRTWARQRQ